MAIKPKFDVGEAVRLADSQHVAAESRAVRGVVTEIHQGRTFGNSPRETGRWEYIVDFDSPLGSRLWILEGVLTKA